MNVYLLIEGDYVEKLISTVAPYKRIEKLVEKYYDLNSVTLALQVENMKLAESR